MIEQSDLDDNETAIKIAAVTEDKGKTIITSTADVLPKIENPRSFIYSKLGIAYRNITKDNDYSKAIDYLTLATAASSSEEDVRDYTDLINKLKYKYIKQLIFILFLVV